MPKIDRNDKIQEQCPYWRNMPRKIPCKYQSSWKLPKFHTACPKQETCPKWIKIPRFLKYAQIKKNAKN